MIRLKPQLVQKNGIQRMFKYLSFELSLIFAIFYRSADNAGMSSEEDIGKHQRCAKKSASIQNYSNGLEAVTSLTDSSEEIERLYKKFQKIIDTQSNIYITDSQCLMECGRPRATVLLPCKHQPICNECYVIWKIYVLQHKNMVFCPACKGEVVQTLFINN